MENIRSILLLVGVVIILGIYLFARLKTLRQSPSRRDRPKTAARHRKAVPGLDSFGVDERADSVIDDVGELFPDTRPAGLEETVIAAPARNPQPPVSPDRVFSLFVTAPPGVPFRGPMLLGAMTNARLVFGDMQIFHRIETLDGTQKTLFSVANIREPGTFDPAAMENFSTAGVALFMQVRPGVDAVWAFEAMVEAAHSLADSLGGTICDSTRSVLSKQSIGHMRDEVIGCQLQQRVSKAAS